MTFNPFDCDHARTVVRWRTYSNGTKACVLQCLCCGGQLRSLGKNDPERVGNPQQVPFDEELRERVQAEWRKHAEARYQESQAKRAQENDQWWADYDAYRQTPEWRERRRLVLERDNYVCQACRQRRATQAHHLTYKHLKREPLFDLVAVCKPCHDALHNRDQEQEAAA